MHEDILADLEQRLGRLHARQRLGIETDHEAQVFGQGLTFFHPENSTATQAIIRIVLQLTGLYWRARRNTARIVVRQNDIVSRHLPARFDGFTILHLSDLHVDLNEAAMRRVSELVADLTTTSASSPAIIASRPTGRSPPRSTASNGCGAISRVRSMACSATTTPSRWCRRWRPWASAC